MSTKSEGVHTLPLEDGHAVFTVPNSDAERFLETGKDPSTQVILAFFMVCNR